MIGAYFSRVISFQNSVKNLTFESGTTKYMDSMILLRLIYGLTAGFFIYFLIHSGIVTSNLFPEIGEDGRIVGNRGFLSLWSRRQMPLSCLSGAFWQDSQNGLCPIH